MSITELSVKRPSLIIVLFTIITFFGLYGYSTLTYELLPDISSPVVTVSTVYPGAGPAEVENSVTKPIEDAISTIENLESTQAISQEGFSTVIATLKYGTDTDKALQDAQRKIDAMIGSLPEDVMDPSLGKFSLSEMPIMSLGATSDMESVAFTDLFNNKIQPELARIEGVAQVRILGGDDREISVNVDSDKLNYYGISLLQISQAISSSNLDFPTGSIQDAEQDVLVRLSGKLKGLNELRDLVVRTMDDGSLVYLKDVAEVYDTKKETSTISRINGQNSLGIQITKQSDGNTVSVAEEVKLKTAELELKYTDMNLQFEISQDSSVFTLEAADAVIHDLLIAIVLVAFIMLMFLHDFRNAIIVMVAIPVSVVATFAVMSLAGFTLNLMTLLALSLVIGILVDDSIVVLENIHARMEKGISARKAAIDTWKQIGMSVTSITLVIVVVFLPIGLVSGIVADLMRQFSLVVVAATIISLLVSFTLTPFLASRFTKVTHLSKDKWHQRPLIWFEAGVKWIENGFKSMLDIALRWKITTMILIFAMVFMSFTLMTNGYIGSEFAAGGDNGEFIIKMELPKETPIQQTNYISQQVEEILLNDQYVTSVFASIGASSGGAGNGSAYIAEINAKLVPAIDRPFSSEQYARDIKYKLNKDIPGVEFSAAAVGMVGGGTAAPIVIELSGPNLDELIAFSEAVIANVETVSGTSQVKASVEGGNPEVSVDIDRDRMASLGLSLDIVGATMQNALTGNTDTKFKDGDYEYDLRVQIDAFDRESKNDLQELTFLNSKGELIKLSQFATISNSFGPSRLERKDKITSMTVESQLIGRDVGSVGAEITALLDKMDKPEGATISMGGDIESQTEAFGSLAFALMTSILLVYLIMVALYDNWVYPFVVMFSIPVALIGALLALALTMQNMSIFGMLGLIMLVGLVVKNAILIVDFVNQLKAEGMDRKKAVVEGTIQRFRPIFMTTIAMVIAMIPIATASGAGSEWKNALAWVLIGGLSSSMILTMIIVPVAYMMVDNMTEWLGKKFGKKEKSEIKPELATS